MKIKNSEVLYELRAGADNPRNSEGSFARLKDGRIMFAYSRYSGKSWRDEAPADIAAVYIKDDGGSMDKSVPEILVSANEYSGISNIMSVSLMRMQNGDLGLFYMLKYDRFSSEMQDFSPIISEYALRRSADDKSFPKENEVFCLSKHLKSYYVINNDRVLKTLSGRLIIPAARHRAAYTDAGLSFDAIGTVQVFYSDDDGASWNEASGSISLPTTSHSRTGLQEPGAYELPSGVLCLFARTDRMCQYESFSLDNGIMWTPAQASNFSSPDSPMKIARNPYNGRYYAVWNPIPNYNGRKIAKGSIGRTPLVIAESEDGINFSEYCVIEDDSERGFCYPAIFFVNEKRLLVSYCSGRAEEGCCLCSTTIRRIELE